MAKRCRILVVEDEEQIQEILRDALILDGYDVELEGSAPAALNRLRLEDYDLLIVDLTLRGGLDGYAVAEEAAQKGIGAILTSGNPRHMQRAAASGHAFLPKPFRLRDLSALIVDVMERTGAECALPPRRSPEQRWPASGT